MYVEKKILYLYEELNSYISVFYNLQISILQYIFTLSNINVNEILKEEKLEN